MDLTTLCRSCMLEIGDWKCENFDQKVMDMFTYCTKITLKKIDKLPKQFCYNCITVLKSSYAYIKKAHRVDHKLKKLVSKLNSSEGHSITSKQVSESLTRLIVEPINNHDESPFKTKENIDNKNVFDEDDEKSLLVIKNENINNGNDKKEINLVKPERHKQDNSANFSVEFKDSIVICIEKIKEKTKLKTENIIKKCPTCKKVFTRKGWYARHMKWGHIEQEVSKKEMAELKKQRNEKKKVCKETKDTGDPNNEIKCRVCNRVFTSKSCRTKHLNEEHSGRTPGGQKIFLCPYCPKTFSKYTHMYYHTTQHADVAKHPCSSCGKVYRVRRDLEQHVRTSHQLERPYACDKCHMRFKVKGVLVTHLKWHDGIKPYLCNICGRSFSQSGNLESHMRVHTGEKKFACVQCEFRSTSQVSLKRHELRHRGERPFACSYCPKRFYESCSLVRHIRSHTRERPYRCPYCSRMFTDTGKRKRHLILIHKMAADEIPPMNKDGGSIACHVRRHTGERPYRCPYCSRTFVDTGKRRRHFMLKHKMAADQIPPMTKDGGPVEQ